MFVVGLYGLAKGQNFWSHYTRTVITIVDSNYRGVMDE